MAWVAVAGAAVGVVGSKVLNSGGGGTGGSAAAAVADPFASQRGQYQQPLSDLMSKQAPGQGAFDQMSSMASGSQLDPTATAWQWNLASQRPNAANTDAMSRIAGTQGTAAGAQLSAMTAPGGSFSTSDPSYQFRLQQGQQAVERSALAKGIGFSGNALQALTDYGQGAASQEYGAQFARLSSLSQQQQSQQQQQFGQLGAMNAQDAAARAQEFGQYSAINQQGMAANANQFGQLSTTYNAGQNQYQNEYARLAQLSGANTGQPGQAGQLLQQQQAGAAAYTAPVLNKISSTIGNQISDWFSGGSAASAAPSNEVF